MPGNVTFPTIEEMNGIDPDRREIIEIIKSLIEGKSPYNTIPQILINLDHPKLPTDAGKHINNSKVIITRLLKCDETKKSLNRISEIKYSDLLSRFKVRFAKHINDIDLVFDEISNDHGHYYVYYYESNPIISEYPNISFGIVGFDIDSKTNEWESGMLYYFKDLKIYRKFIVTRISPSTPNPDALFFSAISDDQVNLFTVSINRRDPKKRGILSLTYSVLETQERYSSAGIAILEKIENNKFINKINKLIREGINAKIINALYQRKNTLDGKVYDNITDFKTDQLYGLNKVIGVWTGIYFRTDFSDGADYSSNGGICKFVLKIESSGECELFWGNEKSEYNSYKGFVEFPFPDHSFLKIYFEFLKKEKTHKIYVLLTSDSKTESEFSYKGVITGWMTNNRKLYSSPFYMKRIQKANQELLLSIEELLIRENSKRISKNQKNEIESVDSKIIGALKRTEIEFIATFDNCMPKVAPETLPFTPQLANVEVYENRESQELKKLLFETLEESKEILSIGIANYRLTEELGFNFYKRFLDREGKARIMFLDPNGKEIVKRELAEGRGSGSLVHTVIHGLENLKKFREIATKNNPQLKNNIQWLCYDFQPTINALIIDKKLAIIHHYSISHRGSDVPTIVVRKEARNIISFYIDEVERIWDSLNKKSNQINE